MEPAQPNATTVDADKSSADSCIEARISPVPAVRLGQVLRQARRAAGVTIAAAAARADVPQRWLFWAESGRARADAMMVADLLAIYGTTIDELLPPRRPLLMLAEGDSVDRYVLQLGAWRPMGERPCFRSQDMDTLSKLTGQDCQRMARRVERAVTGASAPSIWLAHRLRHH